MDLPVPFRPSGSHAPLGSSSGPASARDTPDPGRVHEPSCEAPLSWSHTLAFTGEAAPHRDPAGRQAKLRDVYSAILLVLGAYAKTVTPDQYHAARWAPLVVRHAGDVRVVASTGHGEPHISIRRREPGAVANRSELGKGERQEQSAVQGDGCRIRWQIAGELSPSAAGNRQNYRSPRQSRPAYGGIDRHEDRANRRHGRTLFATGQ
jgi:hypothetical protein